jgi:hypothetical protein
MSRSGKPGAADDAESPSPERCSLEQSWAEYKALTAAVLPGFVAKLIGSRHFEKILAAGLAATAFYLILGLWLWS